MKIGIAEAKRGASIDRKQIAQQKIPQ